MKKHFQTASRVLGLHIIFALASFLFSKSFHWALANDQYELITSRLVIYSIITTFFYLAAVHSIMWEVGKKDNNEEERTYMMKGLVIGLIVSIPAMVLFILSLFIPAGLIAALYRFYQFIFWGFMAIGNGSALSCLCVMIIEPVWCMITYIMGRKKIDVVAILKDKIIYKQK